MAMAACLLLLPAAPAAAFSSCVSSLKSAALKAGIDRQIVERAFDGAEHDDRVIRAANFQPEFKEPVWDYFARTVDEQRVTEGRAMLRRHDALLRAIESRYGVDRHVVVAVWGMETDYGKEMGGYFLPHALATLVCGNNRAKFARQQLMTALSLVQRGDVRLEDLQGSWAGAFGQTQFIPTTYRALAVDHDGDGRRDLVRSVPDALASTANFLRNSGWTKGASWMIEAKVPSAYRGTQGRQQRASLSTWASRGVTRADGSALSGGARAGLLLPAGARGPGFLVFANFDAIFAYNRSENYALAISHLADRLAGYPALRTAWPTDDPGLSRAQRIALQKLLTARGHDTGGADGRFGAMTRAAIKAAQRELGMTADSRAGVKLYRALGGR